MLVRVCEVFELRVYFNLITLFYIISNECVSVFVCIIFKVSSTHEVIVLCVVWAHTICNCSHLYEHKTLYMPTQILYLHKWHDIAVYRLIKAISMDQTFMQIDTNSGVFTMTHKNALERNILVKNVQWRMYCVRVFNSFKYTYTYECMCCCAIYNIYKDNVKWIIV